MEGTVRIVLDQTFRNHDCVLEVVPIPRHEPHENVEAECQLAVVSSVTVSDDLTGTDLLTDLNERPLVDCSVLVGPPELLQPEAVVLHQPAEGLTIVAVTAVATGVNDDLLRSHLAHHTRARRYGDGPRVTGSLLLEPGPLVGRLREE